MNAADDVLISMKGIKRVFYTDEVETHALWGVDLEIRKGEYVSIAGPSGSGKSTLLALIGLLDSPSQGQYLFKREPVEKLDILKRAVIRNREIGFIFQSFNLIGDLTVYENVELPLTYRGMSGSERKQRVNRALERLGMSHRTALPVTTFRRPAATRCRSQGSRRQPVHPAGGRTDRQPRFA